MILQNELAELYQSVVEDTLGLVARIDENNDVRFKHPELGNFFFSLNANDDPEYMMLVYPSFMDARHGVSLDKLFEVCNKVNNRSKGVKISILNNEDRNVVATVEMLVAGPNEMPSREHLSAILNRTLSMMVNAVRMFAEEIKPMVDRQVEQSQSLQLH